MNRSVKALALIACFAVACSDREKPAPAFEAVATVPEAPRTANADLRGRVPIVTSVSEGLAAPEAVLHDRASDVYLVSNINGSPEAEDDDGFISRVSPAGSILALKWIDGANPDVTLHGPKGMDIHGDTLYVVDVGAVRSFDRITGRPKASWRIPDASFLNDVAVDEEGNVFVTETAIRMTPKGPVQDGTYTIHRFSSSGARGTAASGNALHGPNGIAAGRDGVVFAAFMGKELFRLPAVGTPQLLAELPYERLDGLVRLDDDSFLVTSWGAKGIYHVTPEGEISLAVSGVANPASINDAGRGTILIPLLLSNRVLLQPWRARADAAARE